MSSSSIIHLTSAVTITRTTFKLGLAFATSSALIVLVGQRAIARMTNSERDLSVVQTRVDKHSRSTAA